MDDDSEKSISQIHKEYFEKIVQLLKECTDLEMLDFMFQLLCKCSQ